MTAPAIGGDRPDFTYRTHANEVRLSFSATDQNDHGVATLQASDFAVVDKDVIVRNFQSFTRSNWTKLEIAILLDTSESVRPRFRQEIADTLELISQTEGIPDENLSMFSFDGADPVQLCTGNCRRSHADQHLSEEHARGLTPLFDTILLSTTFLSQHGDPDAQKVLIIFSDGLDTVSRHSLGDATNASLLSGVQLNCIDLNKHASASQGASVLGHLASSTGGRYFPPPNGARDAMNVILEDFRASYQTTYSLPNRSSGFHQVRILPTHNLNLQFRSRSGYYFPNPVQ
jgi:VWFA-related protein